MKRSTYSAEVIANQEHLAEREAHLRRFGYDSQAAIQFVLAQALPLTGAVLEVGTGKGRFLVELARYVAAITTVDIAAEEQQSARLNARYARVEEKVRFVLRDAARLPWRAATFDAAVTMNAMHHIRHFEQVLEEMLRVVKPGGKIVLADFSPRGFQIIAREHRAEGRDHPREHYDFGELQRLLRKRGLATQLCKGCNQEVLVAKKAIIPSRPRTGLNAQRRLAGSPRRA
jgi:ubiquinone/menaquinone biosynthesis C-methylase UbiE